MRDSHGARHAYGLIDGGFLYMFYLDTIDNAIRAARAPLDHLFERGAFRLLADGAYSQPALPEGFDRADKSFLRRKPGRADPILPGAPKSMRFQAARLRGTPYFLGIEHRLIRVDGKGAYEAWLHLSRDLIHWSAERPFPARAGRSMPARSASVRSWSTATTRASKRSIPTAFTSSVVRAVTKKAGSVCALRASLWNANREAACGEVWAKESVGSPHSASQSRNPV